MKPFRKAERKKLKLLDISSEQEIDKKDGTAADQHCFRQKRVAFCNRLFYLERFYKELC